MKISVVNVSSAVPMEKLAAAVAAISRQISGEFAAEWGVSASLTATNLDLTGNVPIDTPSDAALYLGDRVKDPNRGAEIVYGYHDKNYNHIAYSFVYLDVCKKYKEDWTVTLSHEILEMLVDPDTGTRRDGPDPRAPDSDAIVQYALEVCDPVQGDFYNIDGTSVSNFVSKRYFGMVGPSTATNHLNLDLKPFGVRPKGYIQYRDAAGETVRNGDLVDRTRLAARMMLARHRRNAKRSSRFLAVRQA